MNTHILQDPWQKAADEASGFEGQRWNHNLKSGLCMIEGVQTAPDFCATFLLELAMHGSLKFVDGELVGKDLKRFAVEAPGQEELPEGWAPNTGCLCVGDDGQLFTYAAASWGCRSAFVAQLVKPYQRLHRTAFPLVSLGFGTGLDSFGNHKPLFHILSWRPRKNYAALIGEEEPAAQLSAPRRKVGAANYESGLPPVDRGAPPVEDNDYAPADLDDDDIPL